jgi:hypothetical protein
VAARSRPVVVGGQTVTGDVVPRGLPRLIANLIKRPLRSSSMRPRRVNSIRKYPRPGPVRGQESSHSHGSDGRIQTLWCLSEPERSTVTTEHLWEDVKGPCWK